jgi:hypothetical protein
VTRSFLIALSVTLLAIVPPSAQTLAGQWEGAIQNPQRPIVATVDFDKGAVSFGGGPSQPITKWDDADARIAFDVATGARVLRFSGARRDDTIVGTLSPPEGEPVPFSLTKLPAIVPPRTRVEAWQQDLDAVATRFLRYDGSFDETTRMAARARLERLKRDAGAMSDAQLIVALSRVVAMSGNAHRRLYFVRNRTEVSRLPIRLWWFGDELRIVRTSSEQQALLGCRVTRIGERSVPQAFQRVRDVKAGNESWRRYMSAYYLTSPEVLAGTGVVAETSPVGLTVACDGGVRQVRLTASPVRRSMAPVEAWWDLAPVFRDTDAALDSFALPADRVPRYLRNARENYWFELVPEDSVLYVQYNRAEQMPSKPMAAFVTQVVETITRGAIRAFVVDIRFNTGGDLGVATPLVNTVAPLLGKVPVFVLTGRATFSAGISHAAQWKQRGATLVGEPVGDELDMWSEGGNLVLPNSKLTVHYANGFHKYSRRDYPKFKPYFFELQVDSLVPDVVVETTWDDYKAGHDPLYAVVLQRITR